MIYPITPVGKPRMTARRGSAHTPKAKRYWAFKDEVRARRVSVPENGYHITFYLPMPKSWSEKKKREMDGQPHQQTPDKDNLEKPYLMPFMKTTRGFGMVALLSVGREPAQLKWRL